MAESAQTEFMIGARFVASQLAAPDRIDRAIREIEANVEDDPGVVFDHAKSLIETTCKSIFKELGKVADDDWNINKLAKFTLMAVIHVPEGHSDPVEAKKRFETALTGLVQVVQGLGEIRNKEGEIGHGKEADRVPLTTCHAEFAALAADNVVKFLVDSLLLSQATKAEKPSIAYLENPDFNDFIDDQVDPVDVLGARFRASEILIKMDPTRYELQLTEYRQLMEDELIDE